MSRTTISLLRLKDETNAMHDAGYFVDALAQFISQVGANDPELCEESLDGYVVGGLMAGLRIVGTNLMCRADELNTLIEKAEQSAAKEG